MEKIKECKILFFLNRHKYEVDLTLKKGGHFRSQEEAAAFWTRFFKKFFAEHSDLTPLNINKVQEKGITLVDGRTFSHPVLFDSPYLDTAKKISLAWATLPIVSRFKPPVPKASPIINEAESPLEEKGLVKAEYEFLDPNTHPHILDKIEPKPTRWKNSDGAFLSREELVDREAAYLALNQGLRFDPSIKRIQDTRIGVELGIDERKNYRMNLTLLDGLKEFFGRNTFTSTDIYAKNSPLNGSKMKDGNVIKGAVTASINRLADTVTLLRKVEDQDGASDAYAGRVDNLAKAEELAQFLFLGEIDRFEDLSGLSKGIKKRDDGKYELTFVAQSLLNMAPVTQNERKMFNHEIEAFEQLSKKYTENQPLEIIHPTSRKKYKVVLNPIPIFATQVNWINHLEWLVGKGIGPQINIQSYQMLNALADKKINELDPHDIKIQQIRDAQRFLYERRFKLPWQEIMMHAFLCHLLDLPQVINCKSCVDRTGGCVIPLIVAMKQWLHSGKKVPYVDGYYNICKIADLKIAGDVQPFKELFACKMLHEFKHTEFSRGKKGYLLNTKDFFNWILADLLPARYVHKSRFSRLFDSLRKDSEYYTKRKLFGNSEAI